jgi:hypothetical protein
LIENETCNLDGEDDDYYVYIEGKSFEENLKITKNKSKKFKKKKLPGTFIFKDEHFFDFQLKIIVWTKVKTNKYRTNIKSGNFSANISTALTL